jgi:hypothetical protein
MVKPKRIRMVLRYDIGLNRVDELSSKSLIDKFTEKLVKGGILKQWLDVGWQRNLGHIPRFHLFLMGWIFF